MKHIKLFENFTNKSIDVDVMDIKKAISDLKKMGITATDITKNPPKKDGQRIWASGTIKIEFGDDNTERVVKWLTDNEFEDIEEIYPELFEAVDKSEITWKDRGRIEDIVKKANGSKEKELSLAAKMAKSITDGYKALRRALAAEAENYHDMAAIFFARASELGVR